MFPHADTCYAALRIERDLALRRADRLAPLLDAAKVSRSAPAPAGFETTIARWVRLARAVRSLSWVPRSSHS